MQVVRVNTISVEQNSRENSSGLFISKCHGSGVVGGNHPSTLIFPYFTHMREKKNKVNGSHTELLFFYTTVNDDKQNKKNAIGYYGQV